MEKHSAHAQRIQAILERQEELRAAARKLTQDVNEAHFLVHRVLMRALAQRESACVKALIDELADGVTEPQPMLH